MNEAGRGVAAKLVRAAELLNQLDWLVVEYLRDNPYSLIVELDRAALQYKVRVDVVPTPLSFAVIFGEVLHDLRSALDHTARLLVQADGNEPVDKGRWLTTFPIHSERPGRGVDIAPGVSSAIRDALDAVQPYNDAEPEKNLLWRLQALNNIDKHRLLSVTALIGSGGAAFVPAPLDPERATTEEERRHIVRLIPGIEQVFDVTEDEVFDPATVAGSWAYTVGLGGTDTGFSNQLVGTGKAIAAHVAEHVLPKFGEFIENRAIEV